MSKRKNTIPHADLLKLMDSTDITIKIEVLTFINNIIKLLSDKEKEEGSYEKMLDGFNISGVLMVISIMISDAIANVYNYRNKFKLRAKSYDIKSIYIK
jgi:hypothetical protein